MSEVSEIESDGGTQETPSGNTQQSSQADLIGEWVDHQDVADGNRRQRSWRRQQSVASAEEKNEPDNVGNLEELEKLAQGLEKEKGSESEDIIQIDSDSSANTLGIPIGENENTRIVLEMDEESKEVAITTLCLGDTSPQPGLEEVLETLKTKYKVISGIDEEALRDLIERAAEKEVSEHTIVARSQLPEPGEDGRIEYHFLAEAEDKTLPDGAALQLALEEETPRAVLQHNLQTFLVAPGQLLAEIIPPTEGVNGQDVFGKALSASGQPVEKIQIGDNVVEEENRYTAKTYGYACILEDSLNVISPLWTSKDKMRALFIHFAQGGQEPEPESAWVMKLLEEAGIRHGIEETAIEKLCRGTAAKTRRALLLARGEPAQHGVDAHFKPALDFDSRPGRVREDGSIDFRDRNIISSVAENQFLGEFLPATEGKNGMNLLGEEQEAQNGQDGSFSAAEGVREAEEDGVTRYYSEKEGSVHSKDGSISVLPIVSVNGDVDYEVGNIDTQSDVEIQGSVLSGFSVRTKANVIIGGRVENNARVWAEGSVVISQAIVGKEASVISGGELECKFIQNSRVVAEGDIRVGSYIFNARVHAGGSIEVSAAGGARAGGIVGGEVFVGKELECVHLGSAALEYTLVGCRPSPLHMAQLHKKRTAIATYKQDIDATLKILGVKKLDNEQINIALTNFPTSQRPKMVAAFNRANQAAQSLILLEEEVEQMLREGKNAFATGVIKATQDVHPEVEIKFGEKSLKVEDMLKACQFSMVKEEIVRSK